VTHVQLELLASSILVPLDILAISIAYFASEFSNPCFAILIKNLYEIQSFPLCTAAGKVVHLKKTLM
jgi:hypothetical protein